MTVNRDDIIIDEAPGIPIVSLDFFQRALLPQCGITDDEMGVIFANVENSGSWNKTTKRWTKFEKDPMRKSGKENEVFSYMKDVMDSILEATVDAVPKRAVISSYQSNQNKFSHSGTYNSDYRSDGNFILENNSSRGYPGEHLELGKGTLVFDVVALFEYKKHISAKNSQDVSSLD
jgi:hypothetical protein